MEKIKKTVIFSGYGCNNACRFCINNDARRQLPNKNTTQILQEMADARRRGRTYLELIGGELTIRPDIFILIKTARDLGFEVIAMATNGRMLSYGNFAQKLADAGLTDIIFSIHGYDSQTHDNLTKVSGSFKQLLKGLENIRALGKMRICSNTTIVKQNYRFLAKIGKLILEYGIKVSEFIFADPTSGGVHENFNELMPRISQAAPYIHKCLDLAKGREDIRHWHIRYVPVCYFIGYEEQISEIYEKRTFTTEHIAPDFKNFDVENSREGVNRIKPEKCKDCRHYGICEGIWTEYVKNYGDEELKPVMKS